MNSSAISRISFSFWLYLRAIQVLMMGSEKNRSLGWPLGGKWRREQSRYAARSVPPSARPCSIGASFSVSITSFPSDTLNANACSHQIQRPFDERRTGAALSPPDTPCRSRMSTAYFADLRENGCFRPSSTSPPHQYSPSGMSIS